MEKADKKFNEIVELLKRIRLTGEEREHLMNVLSLEDLTKFTIRRDLPFEISVCKNFIMKRNMIDNMDLTEEERSYFAEFYYERIDSTPYLKRNIMKREVMNDIKSLKALEKEHPKDWQQYSL